MLHCDLTAVCSSSSTWNHGPADCRASVDGILVVCPNVDSSSPKLFGDPFVTCRWIIPQCARTWKGTALKASIDIGMQNQIKSWHLVILQGRPHPSFLYLSLNVEGNWSTTDDFMTSFLHFSLFSTAFWDLANSRLVHALMLSSHLFFGLPCLLPPFTVPCKMLLDRPDERGTCPYHFSLPLFTMVRRSSCGPIAG